MIWMYIADTAATKIFAYVLWLFIAIYYNYTLSIHLFLFYEHLMESGKYLLPIIRF